MKKCFVHVRFWRGMKKRTFGACEMEKFRSACAFAQANQILSFSQVQYIIDDTGK